MVASNAFSVLHYDVKNHKYSEVDCLVTVYFLHIKWTDVKIYTKKEKI